MTIEINNPALEALIEERLRNGAFRNVEDFLLDVLQLKPEIKLVKCERPLGTKSLAQLFAESPFKGMSIDFERFPDTLPPSTL